MAYITIVKGDDTDFLDNQYLVVKFNTDINMAGFKAIFSLDNIELTYPDLSAKYIEIILSNEVTSKLKSGKMYGTLKLIDTEDRIRTVTTVIPFNVITTVMNNSVQVSDQSIQMDVSINKNEFNVDMSIVGLSKTVAESYLTKMEQYNTSLNSTAEEISEIYNEVETKTSEAAASANLAEEWATSGVLVDGTDYSAKYYAQNAASSAQTASQKVDAITSLSLADTSLSNITETAKELIRETAGTGLNMFDIVYKDHILTFEETKGFAQLGTYVYKTADVDRYGYPDFYNRCVEEKTAATSTQTTLGDSTITTYNHSNGHVYYDISDKDAVDTFYTTYGACWMYGIDTANERIFLPRNDYYFKNSDAPGEYVEAGLPNIEGATDISVGVSATSGGALTTTASSGSTFASGPYSFKNLEFDASNSNEVYGNADTVQPPGVNAVVYMVVGNTFSDVAITDVTEITTSANDTLPLLCHIASDEELNHPSWLRSAGQWNSGSVYSTVYNYLVSEYTSGTEKTDTISTADGTEYTVTYKVNNGKKIVDAANLTQVENLYNALGSAWYYVLDQTNTQFKLPQSKNMECYTSDAGRLGLDVDAGLPNITGAFYGLSTTASFGLVANSDTPVQSGAFYSNRNGVFNNMVNMGNVGLSSGWSFSAAKSNSIYGNSNTVTPPHTEFYLYFKVANAVQNLQLLNVGEITEALQGKTDQLQAAGASMPGNQYIDLTLGASGSIYTAPTHGWFILVKRSGSNNQYASINNSTSRIFDERQVPYANASATPCVPAQQGEEVLVQYTVTGETLIFRFIYAKGASND